ncbi:hypothetical protein [Borrelia miyamotoi]|uniref:Uncharacterized protein n=1 Tax=Borrelia miyamotoi TaxID=47466 RepID=A0AAQ2X145_9SPIR|nr:hypothetical protein [Borrelia miyamotoi]AGT27152.1 hypothetical protein I871_00840 [Borrelia miyamotoi LB-2001]AJA58351.1 hypothetical protein RJ61_00755 [Borrelia miyamotoi]AOW95429.1 hypothetical protein AXH25_00765 [Borrelia miyamotoi]QTL83312.1 hypothetical protein bmLB2001_000150 [Borrelia miyamotoi]WAZ85396.1 hypothetical protein O5400_03515 [Borrelia miyamotoi]
MLQVYFISVLINVLGGLVLAFPILGEQFKCLIIFEDFVNIIQDNKKVRSIFGTISLIASIFEIIIPYDLPIIGNLLPAISLFFIGFIFRQPVPISIQNNKGYGKFKFFIESNKKLIGIFALIIGIIHFFAAKVPFL